MSVKKGRARNRTGTERLANESREQTGKSGLALGGKLQNANRRLRTVNKIGLGSAKERLGVPAGASKVVPKEGRNESTTRCSKK